MTVQASRRPSATTLGVDVVVDEVRAETADSRTLVLRFPGEVSYLPGQFVTLRIPSERTGSVARCYSLSTAPGVDDLPAITVKRTKGGYGSNWLCDNVTAGTTLHALSPSGVFTPSQWHGTLRLFAAGSGITPVMSIAKYALAHQQCSVELFYANRDRESVIFAGVLSDLARRHPDRLRISHWLESERGMPDAAAVDELCDLDDDDEAFICGPAPFMDLVEAALRRRGTPHSRIHVERYVSLEGDPFTLDRTDSDDASVDVSVSIDGETTSVACGRSTPILDALLSHGVDAPYSCREGDCGSCMARLVDGEVIPGDGVALEPEDIDDGYILTCQATPSSGSLAIEFD